MLKSRGQLASKQLVGMLLIVIVRKALVPDFSDVKVCAVGRGIMGVMVHHIPFSTELTANLNIPRRATRARQPFA